MTDGPSVLKFETRTSAFNKVSECPSEGRPLTLLFYPSSEPVLSLLLQLKFDIY